MIRQGKKRRKSVYYIVAFLAVCICFLISWFIIFKFAGYRVSTDTYESGDNICINFPKITYKNNSKKTENINEIIDHYIQQLSHSNSDLGLDYFITEQASDLFSVCFYGIQCEEDGAGIIYSCYGMNIDLKNERILNLGDMVGAGEEALRDRINNDDFEIKFGKIDSEQVKRIFSIDSDNKDKWYIIEHGIGIIIDGLPFQSGYYTRIEIPYN